MSAGLQIWDASGNLIFDTPTRCGRVLGTVSFGNTNGSVSNAQFAAGTPFWFVSQTSPGYAAYQPTIAVASNTLTWTWSTSGAAGNQGGTIIYGIY